MLNGHADQRPAEAGRSADGVRGGLPEPHGAEGMLPLHTLTIVDVVRDLELTRVLWRRARDR